MHLNSPDSPACGFWPFPTLKERLAGCSFGTEEDLEKDVEAILKDLCNNGLQFVFGKWHERLQKCISVVGDDVEKCEGPGIIKAWINIIHGNAVSI